jgi:hexosaminidase
MKRVEKIVSSKGKKMIGWDEILDGGLAEGAAVMSWRGMKGGIEAAKQKHEVVMSPTTFAYLDYIQGDPSVENPIYAALSLKTSYDFEPVPEGVDPKYILGGQANLWTELIPTIRHAFYMTYPRAFATAEVVWSPKESKNWDNFVNRTESHFRRFDVMEQSISKAIYDPIVSVTKDGENYKVKLSSDINNTEIHYTIDNTFPDKFSPKYTEEIVLPAGDYTLKTINIRNGQTIGRMLSIPRTDLVKRAK